MNRVPTGLLIVLALVLSWPLHGCTQRSSDAPPNAVDPAFEESARGASNQLRVKLQQELQVAMQAGGPVAAIEVCRTRAAEIAAEVTAQTQREVRRVSIKDRNPANRADEVEAAVLAAFAQRSSLADTAFVRDGAPVYMRAIRIDSAACLICHGPSDALAPELNTALAEHYPGDLATGYAAGDLRGAFVVRGVR